MEKDIYILLTDTGTIFTKAIKLYTKQEMNHVSIAFDEGLEEVYSFGRKQKHNPFIGGFVAEDLTSPLFSKASCAVYRLTVLEKDYTKMRNKVMQIKKDKHEYKYNILGLIGVVFNTEIKRKRAYFCSEFVAMILKESSVPVINTLPCFVQPHHFSLSKHVVEIFKGDLKFYLTKNNLKAA
jgi:hypothetical protein